MLLILVVTGVQYVQVAQEQEIEKRAQTAVRLLSATFVEAVIVRDFAMVSDTAKLAVESADLQYVRVLDPKGRVLAEVAREGVSIPAAGETPRQVGVYHTSGEIAVAGESFGRLEVGLDTSPTLAIVASARERAFKIAAVEMALVALFSFILGTLLTRQLRGLEVAVDTVASGDFHARVPVKRDDELGRVAARFNSMAERLGLLRERQAGTVSILAALSRAQQLHLVGRDDGEVHGELLATIRNVSSSDAACIRHGDHASCEVCTGLSSDQANSVGDEGWGSQEQPGGSWLSWIPLAQGDQPAGFLVLRRPSPHVSDDLSLLTSMAPQIAALLDALDERREQARKEELSRAVLANVIDGIARVDRGGRILDTNPAFDRMFGLEAEQATGQPLTRWIEALPDVMDVNAGNKREVEARGEDGRELQVELACARVGAEGDRAAFVLWVIGDITERKRVEDETLKAMEAAREAQRAKAAFLANMSHELRTPMNGVLGMLQLLQADQLTPLQMGNVDIAVSAAEHLLEILDDVLDFSKAEAGKMRLEATTFDFAQLVEDGASLLSHGAAVKGVELTCEVPLGETSVIGDPTRLKQVLVNLIGNAIKFTEQGRVKVSLASQVSGAGRRRFQLEVKDSGIGIAAEALAGLFSPFQQADTSTTRRYGGTGLGLSICRELITLMGGTLEAESREGEGARFVAEIDLPLGEPAEALPSLDGIEVVVHGDLDESVAVIRRYVEAMGATLAGSLQESPAAALVLVSRGPSIQRALAAVSEYPNRRIVVTEHAWTGEEGGLLNAKLVAGPASRRDLAEALLATERQRESGLTLVGFNGEVLLVEDNLVNQRVMMAMLHRLGVKSEVASNGAVAVERLKKGVFRLVLMDCQMPVMDGFEATRILRERGFNGPIVAVTANVLSEDREACESAGMNDFLAKPVRLNDLQVVLERYLPARGPADSEDDQDREAL